MGVKTGSSLIGGNAPATHKAIEHRLDLPRGMVRTTAIKILPQRVTTHDPPTATMVQAFAALPKHLPRHDPPPLRGSIRLPLQLANLRSRHAARRGEKNDENSVQESIQFHFRMGRILHRRGHRGKQALTTKDTKDQQGLKETFVQLAKQATNQGGSLLQTSGRLRLIFRCPEDHAQPSDTPKIPRQHSRKGTAFVVLSVLCG